MSQQVQSINQVIDFTTLLLADYRKIAFPVVLESKGGKIGFVREEDEKVAHFIFTIDAQQHREKYRAVMQKKTCEPVSDASLDERIGQFVSHAIGEWLLPLALSKVPVIVTEMMGHHLIVVIRGKGFSDEQIDSTDWVLSNYRHEVKQLIRSGADPQPHVLSDLI